MGSFFLVLFIFILCFSSSFLQISKVAGSEVMADTPKGMLSSFIWTYLIALGDFDTGAFSSDPNAKLVWLFFLICTVLIQIVMLNLLISIISDTYARV